MIEGCILLIAAGLQHPALAAIAVACLLAKDSQNKSKQNKISHFKSIQIK